MFPSESDRAPTWCYSVFAAAEAGVMPRVLEQFAKRGLVPARFDGAVGGPADGELTIDLQVDGLAAETAEHVAQCLRGLYLVERVLLSRKARAAEARLAL